jgi:hypothetical protein
MTLSVPDKVILALTKRGKAARCPVCPLRVYWVYNEVADSGDVVTEKQDFSILDTHEPMTAMPLPPFCLHTMDS